MTHRGPFQPLPFCDSVGKWMVSHLQGSKFSLHPAKMMQELLSPAPLCPRGPGGAGEQPSSPAAGTPSPSLLASLRSRCGCATSGRDNLKLGAGPDGAKQHPQPLSRGVLGHGALPAGSGMVLSGWVNPSPASLPGSFPPPLAESQLHGQRVEWPCRRRTRFHSTADGKAEIQHFKPDLQIDRFSFSPPSAAKSGDGRVRIAHLPGSILPRSPGAASPLPARSGMGVTAAALDSPAPSLDFPLVFVPVLFWNSGRNTGLARWHAVAVS